MWIVEVRRYDSLGSIVTFTRSFLTEWEAEIYQKWTNKKGKHSVETDLYWSTKLDYD